MNNIFSNLSGVQFNFDISSFKHSHRSHKVCYTVKESLERERLISLFRLMEEELVIGIMSHARLSEAQTSVLQIVHVLVATQKQMIEKQKEIM